MEILETVPIYGMPNWIGVLFIASIVLALIAITICKDTDYVGPIIGMISAIGIILTIAGAVTFKKFEFKRNEYIVRLNDMPAQEFIEKYEVTKRFDYSDVIQVREIEKK